MKDMQIPRQDEFMMKEHYSRKEVLDELAHCLAQSPEGRKEIAAPTNVGRHDEIKPE